MKEIDERDEPVAYHELGRRELFKRWLPPVIAGAFLGGAGGVLHGRPGRHQPPAREGLGGVSDWRPDPTARSRLVVAAGQGPVSNLRRGLEAFGGIGSFIRPGEKVVIKPNCAWDRTPEQAANTNPELVGELARLCLAAGADTVTVLDSTCHDPDRAFDRSGIAAAARGAGARIAHQGSGGTSRLNLGGTRLGAWEILRPLAEADRVINVPIVKHHSLTSATLGMKNWFGALVGNRSQLHQRVHQVCAELGVAFRPTLTVIDATRILTGGGPTGGSLSLVRSLDRIAVATDAVAADAWGGSLLELDTHRLPHLEIAARLDLGTADWRSLEEVV
ncbi:MAG: DUF362 domain-containing protein [Acidobacteriota bacterium]|nr:DUF362 domain-containing protein [Acidobacteriota bacterium]